MTSAANDGYTWHLAYDIMGRVQNQTLQTPTLLTICDNPPDCTIDHTAPGHIQAQYSYDQDGRLKDLYYPGGMAEASQVQPGTRYQYAYDLLGRALSLSREYAPGFFELRAQNAQYNAASQITSWQEITDTYPATWHTLTRSYRDQRGWVSNIRAVNQNNQALLDLTYGYLANGRVNSVTDVVNPGQSVSSYEYDQLNRLTKATTPNWALQWTYDEFGNRLTQTKVPGSPGTPPEITLSYGESTNRITTAGYSYDLNGNLTALPGLTIGYDVFDRAVTMNSSTAKYDAFGRRIFRQSGSTTRVYFYDLGGRLLAEYANLGPGAWPTRTLQYFAGQRLGDYTDRIGNVRYSRSTGGWRHYYPFGEEITGTSNDTYKFADLYRDADTGLDYAMARYHSSTLGRFLTPDPYSSGTDIADPQSLNHYSYAQNDPVNNIDPNGLFIVRGTNRPPPTRQLPPSSLPGILDASHGAPSGVGVPLDDPLTRLADLLAQEERVQELRRTETLKSAAGRAIGALRNRAECRDLFDGARVDPMLMLQDLANRGNSGNIYLGWGDEGGPSEGRVSSAATRGILADPGTVEVSTFVGARITINTNPGAPFLSRGGYPDTFNLNDDQAYRAMTLIHELGHAVWFANNRDDTVTKIRYDQDNSQMSLENTRLVYEKCFR